MNCCICNRTIDEKNKSEEHIIHNGIGGILKSEYIYCRECNSKYGSDEDKSFVQIFAPIIDGLDMNFDRAAGNTSYEGIMCDMEGNLYKTRFKNGKAVAIFDGNGKYFKWEPEKFQRINNDFSLENDTYKMGMAKIAFNYAVHLGIDVSTLNCLFNNDMKKLVEKPVIIPFYPMTLFDSLIEAQDSCNIYHVLRMFNQNNFLYVYIEIFSTFQVYVLLSDRYSGEIYKEYCQKINKNNIEKNKDDVLAKLKIHDYKDAHIIATQYQIDIKKVSSHLKEYHGYDGKNINVLFEKIERIAYEKLRKESYETTYLDMLSEKYKRVDFCEILEEIDVNYKLLFYSQFAYYTSYEEDNINVKNYKLLLNYDDQVYSYPVLLLKIATDNHDKLSAYGHMKFYMLMNHIKYS